MSSIFSELIDEVFSFLLRQKKLVLIGTPTSVCFLRPDGRREEEVIAQVDTGIPFSIIDIKLARELGFFAPDLVVENLEVPEMGKKTFPVVFVSFILGDKEKRSRWLVTDRSHERFSVVVGRNDLAGFLVQINENV